MKYKLIYRNNKIFVVLRNTNKLIEVLGVNKYLLNKKVRYVFINKDRLRFWLMKGIKISIRVFRMCNLYSILNVLNVRNK